MTFMSQMIFSSFELCREVMGSSCGSVGRVVAPETRDWRFKSRHRQNLFTNSTIEKTKIKKKRPGMAHLLKV